MINAAPIRSKAVDEARDVVTGLGAKVAPDRDLPTRRLRPHHHQRSDRPGIRARREGRRGNRATLGLGERPASIAAAAEGGLTDQLTTSLTD